MLFLIIGKLGKRPKTTFQIRIKTNSFKVLQEKKNTMSAHLRSGFLALFGLLSL